MNRSQSVARLEAILAIATAQDRDLSDAELAEWATIRKEIDTMDAARTTPAQPDPATLRRADAPSVITKVRKYSLLKAIGMGLGDPNVGDVGLEKEIHQELSRTKQFRGVAVPINAFLTKTTAGQDSLTPGPGGVLAITDQLLADLLADVEGAILKATILGPLNVSVVAVPYAQKVRVPIKTGRGQAGWIARDGSGTVHDLVFDDVEAEAHSLAIAARLNRSSLIYTPQMESIVRSDLAESFTDAVNTAYLLADGTGNAPVGLVKTLQDASRDFTDEIDANISLASCIAFTNDHVESYADTNAQNRRWLVHPNFKLAVQASPIWAGGVVPISDGKTLADDPMVESFRAEISNTPFIAYGDFDSSFMIQFGPAIDLLSNPYSDTVFLSGGILLRGISDLDFLFRDPKRLAMASDAQATASVPGP